MGPFIITKRYSQSLYQVQGLPSCPVADYKRFYTVARDKIVPISTQLKLCSKEMYNMQLQPSAFISANDVINVKPDHAFFEESDIKSDYINEDYLFQKSVNSKSAVGEDLIKSSKGSVLSSTETNSFASEGNNNLLDIENEINDLDNEKDINESNTRLHSHRSKSESDKDLYDNNVFEQSCLGEKSISGEDINDNKSEEEIDCVSQSKRGRPKGSKNYSNMSVKPTTRITRSKKLSTKQVLSEFSVSLKNLVNQ